LKEKYYQKLIKVLYPEHNIKIKNVEPGKDFYFIQVKMKRTDFEKIKNISEVVSGFLSENIIIYIG